MWEVQGNTVAGTVRVRCFPNYNQSILKQTYSSIESCDCMNRIDSRQYHELCNNVYNSMLLLRPDIKYEIVISGIKLYLTKEGYTSNLIFEWIKPNDEHEFCRTTTIEWIKV